MSLLDEIAKKKNDLKKYKKLENLIINPLRYENNSWKQVLFQKENLKKKNLKIISFNIWSNKKYLKERMEWLIELLEEKNPDIINFQENTIEASKIFQKSIFVQKNFFLSTFEGQENGFKVSIFSKIPFCNLELRYCKNRPFLKGTFGNNELSISCVHLSAENQIDERKEELSQVYELHKEIENSIVLGDFNVHSDDELKFIMEYNYQDLWNDDQSSTFRFSSKKFDRVSYKLKNFGIKKIEIFGKEKKENLIISDHFGLFFEVFSATKEVKNEENSTKGIKKTSINYFQSCSVDIDNDDMIKKK